MRVELFPVAHAFRAGSRLRLTVDAPGGNRAEWIFDTIAAGETVEIAHGVDQPSRIVLPVVDGVAVPPRYPRCTLRGQPCRRVPRVMDDQHAAPSWPSSCAPTARRSPPRRSSCPAAAAAARPACAGRRSPCSPACR